MVEFKKVQEVKGSYYIYLPKRWCTQHISQEQKEVGLKQLDDDSLLILPRDRKIDTQKELDITVTSDDNLNFILNKILTGYIIGASRIIVEMDQKERIPLDFQTKISHLTKGLLGFSIVEQDATRIEIRDLSQSSEIKATMRQMLVKVGLVFEQLIEILAKNGEDLNQQLELLAGQDDIIDEYRYQIDRQTHLLLQNPSLSRQMEVNPVECLHYAQSSRSLERIADHLVNIGDEVRVIGNESTIPKSTISLLRRAYEYYTIVIDLFYKSDAQELHRVLLEKDLEMKDYTVDGKNITDKQIIMHLERIVHHCADILEYRINTAVFGQLS